MLEQLRAHHRRERDGDDAGNDHGACQREGELAKQRTRETGDEADRREHGRQGDGHGDDRVDDFSRAEQGGFERPLPRLDMPVDVLDDHDGIVDHEPDGEHKREQRHQVDRVAEPREHREHADQRQGNGDDRNDGRAQIAEEQEDHHDHDDRRLAQRLHHLPQRSADEIGCVVSDRCIKAGRQLPLDLGEGLAHVGDHRQRICRRGRIDADEHRLQSVEHRGRIRALRPELDLGDVGEAHSESPRPSTTRRPNAAGSSNEVLASILVCT